MFSHSEFEDPCAKQYAEILTDEGYETLAFISETPQDEFVGDVVSKGIKRIDARNIWIEADERRSVEGDAGYMDPASPCKRLRIE